MHNKPCVHVYTGTQGGSLGMSILSCDGTSTHTQACYTAVYAVRLLRTSFSMNAQVVRCTWFYA